MRPHVRRIIFRCHRVVPKLPVFDDAVGDVDSKAGDAAVEPEPIDLIEDSCDFGIPPIEVRLLGLEVVEVVLAGPFVERPGWTTEGAELVIWIASIGFWVGPDVPIAIPDSASIAVVDKAGIALAGV